MMNVPERVEGYGRYDTGNSEVHRPTCLAEVIAVFDIARASNGKQRVTIRAGGHSFDSQALHKDDAGNQLILSSDAFQPSRIEFDRDGPNTVTLGGGVTWGYFVSQAIGHARKRGGPIRIPGSMQTGSAATVGGTLSGDCLSRFSGISGKESAWIESFRILTPEAQQTVNASRTENPDLFHAVIGGHGYLGFVTDATYRLISIDNASCAHTEITTHTSFADLICKQKELVDHSAPPRAVSSAWFTDQVFAERMRQRLVEGGAIKGAVFNSSYARPARPKLPNFLLYHDILGPDRFLIEVAARVPFMNWLFHQGLYDTLQLVHKFDDDLPEFLFFMDGDAKARTTFQALYNRPFPIIQQTYVVPTGATEAFATTSVQKIQDRGLHPTECDMLYVAQDDCLMSANYHLDGFAVSFAFEPTSSDDVPPDEVCALLRELSVDCLNAHGRIHLPKNSHVDRATFRSMFDGQIQAFEAIKRNYDPNLLIQNRFSDQFFTFSKSTKRSRKT